MSLLNQLVPEVKPPKREHKRISHGDCEVDVIPYNANFDPNADKFLPWLWERLKKDGLVKLYFPDGEQTGFASFVKLFSGNVHVVLVVLKDAQGTVVDTVGFATWEPGMMGNTPMGHAGFIFLKDFWDLKTSSEAAERIMRHWFEDLPTKLDIIVGIVADKNVLAQRFLKRIAWTHAGTLPFLHQYNGETCAATLWYVTRAQFESKEPA